MCQDITIEEVKENKTMFQLLEVTPCAFNKLFY